MFFAELGDVRRFADAGRVRSWAGLTAAGRPATPRTVETSPQPASPADTTTTANRGAGVKSQRLPCGRPFGSTRRRRCDDWRLGRHHHRSRSGAPATGKHQVAAGRPPAATHSRHPVQTALTPRVPDPLRHRSRPNVSPAVSLGSSPDSNGRRWKHTDSGRAAEQARANYEPLTSRPRPSHEPRVPPNPDIHSGRTFRGVAPVRGRPTLLQRTVRHVRGAGMAWDEQSCWACLRHLRLWLARPRRATPPRPARGRRDSDRITSHHPSQGSQRVVGRSLDGYQPGCAPLPSSADGREGAGCWNRPLEGSCHARSSG